MIRLLAVKREYLLDLLRDLMFFTACVLFLILSWRNTLLATVLVLALFLIRDLFWHKKNDYGFFITGALLGTATEIICTQFGIWVYSNPTFLNIPLWLPFAWGLAGLLIVRIAECITKGETGR